jgi:hypothetical protein
VGFTARGGSSPLERMRSGWKSSGFRVDNEGGRRPMGGPSQRFWQRLGFG